MMYFKDSNNNLHWLDSSEYEYLLPAGCVQISDAEADAIRAANVPPTVIPELSPRQIRMVLTRHNLRSNVETAIAAGSQDLKDWWEFSTNFIHDHPVLVQMATSLGLTQAQVDAMFIEGATL